jgi:transcriptional regulator with PAS, ATPase and Fis domain
VVTGEDLPEHIPQKGRSIQPVEEDFLEDGVTLHKAVEDYEKSLILGALERSDWVKTRAAKLLNINRTTLVEKIKKQNLVETGSTSAIR